MRRIENRVLAKTKDNAIYNRWKAMVRRCSNPADKRFARYGGRGIRVCARWLSYEAYVGDIERDLGPRPSPKHSIDRIDNEGHYEPGNVRWSAASEQVRNRATTRFVSWRGETRSVPEWASLLGIPQDTLYHRLRSMTVEDAFTRPMRVTVRKPAGRAAA